MTKPDPKSPITNEYLQGAIDHLVETLGGMIEEMGHKIEEMGHKIEEMGNKVDKGFSKATAERQDIKRKLNDLKVDTPTQKEFDQLKSKVDRYHPAN